MKQEDVAYRITSEMIEAGIIAIEHQDLIHAYICQAYAAGFMEGKLKGVNRKPVMQLTRDGGRLKVFESTMVAARICCVSNQSISACANGKNKTAGGYKWKYLEQFKTENHE